MTELIGVLIFGSAGGLGVIALYALAGIIIVQPRTQVVVLRWGKYSRTVSSEGLTYIFPLGRKLYRVSSQDASVDIPKTTVLDANGNPIEVSAVCIYRVREAESAVLRVSNYKAFAFHLANVVVKSVCSRYPYETSDPHAPCLKKESDQVTDELVSELQEMVGVAGIEILQLRITDLTYAPEIAQSMLLRQQAQAMVAARRKIVEGAVTTMQGALSRMHEVKLGLPPTEAESLATNLMLVLCSGERVQAFMPIRVGDSAPSTSRHS
jgi:regulator of protease activity HflC (stomatin/prohibitin superfamily)